MALNVRLLGSNLFIKGVAKMRKLRWISENTRKDRIQHEKICLKMGVALIDKKMREHRRPLEMVWS